MRGGGLFREHAIKEAQGYLLSSCVLSWYFIRSKLPPPSITYMTLPWTLAYKSPCMNRCHLSLPHTSPPTLLSSSWNLDCKPWGQREAILYLPVKLLYMEDASTRPAASGNQLKEQHPHTFAASFIGASSCTLHSMLGAWQQEACTVASAWPMHWSWLLLVLSTGLMLLKSPVRAWELQPGNL